jgi:hypothetical protein
MMQFSRRPFQGLIIIKMCPEVDFVTVPCVSSESNGTPLMCLPVQDCLHRRICTGCSGLIISGDRHADSIFQTNWRWKRSNYSSHTRLPGQPAVFRAPPGVPVAQSLKSKQNGFGIELEKTADSFHS